MPFHSMHRAISGAAATDQPPGQSAAPQRLIITETQASLVSGDFQIIPNSGGMVKNLKTGSFTHEHHFLAIEQLHFEQALKSLKSADDAKAAELAK